MTAADADPGDRFRPVSAEASAAPTAPAAAVAQPDQPTDVRDLDPAPASPAPASTPAPAPAPAVAPTSAPGPPTTQSGGGGGAGGGYGVSTSELGKMADELDEAARLLEKADKGLSESANTARMHSMLAAGRMLSGTTSAWDEEVTRLAKQCRSLADKMRATHTTYTTQEHRTAQEFDVILAGLGGGA